MTQSLMNGAGGLAGVFSIQQRDLAALVEAQTALASGMADVIARCQADMLQAVLDAAGAIPWTNPPKDPGAGIALLFDTVKNAALESSARSNALSETAARAGGAFSATLNGRWLSGLDEWKATLMAAVAA